MMLPNKMWIVSVTDHTLILQPVYTAIMIFQAKKPLTSMISIYSTTMLFDMDTRYNSEKSRHTMATANSQLTVHYAIQTITVV